MDVEFSNSLRVIISSIHYLGEHKYVIVVYVY